MKNKKLTLMVMLVFLSFGLMVSSNNAFAETDNIILPKTEDLSTQQSDREKNISGVVTDETGNPVIGATVVIQGTTTGVITGGDGSFSIRVPEESQIIVSFIGYQTQIIEIGPHSVYNITLRQDVTDINTVVVVGFGTQTKGTLIGAVTQAGNEQLSRTGGVTDLAQTLTGNLPGVTTIQSQGQPGASNPSIFIRGRSTWNNTSPYILVDGVERRMNDIDINEVETISILKDASATAVYGVQGANGVILITTKRGKIGKPVISISANSSMKVPSKLMDKLDAYDAITIKDAAIAKESVINPASWNDYVPYEIRNRYRNQSELMYPEAYPNIDWQDLMMKDFALDHRVNLSASGGNKVAKYFTSASYLIEEDLLDSSTNIYGKGWKPGYNNARFNFRSNVDINVTKSTTFSVNLAAIYTEFKQPAENQSSFNAQILNALYTTPSNIYMPMYENGLWGYTPLVANGFYNPIQYLTTAQYTKRRTTNLTSDFVVNQKLDFITEGLSAIAKFSFDNNFSTTQNHNPGGRLFGYWLDPAIEDAYGQPGFDPEDYGLTQTHSDTPTYYEVASYPWKLQNEADDNGRTFRRMYYQFQINYARSFGRHSVGATGVFTREQRATGSEFPHYREDWVFRGTYNYDSRYMLEFNGAYNGSEKFDSGYRFGFFPSVGLGWAVHNESFLKNQTWLNMLKLRYSYGKIGDDNVNGRWLYTSEYGTSNAVTGMNNLWINRSPYTIYKQTAIGNPNIHWETAQKTNYGLDMVAWNGLLTLTLEYFTERRSNIIILGNNRTIPIYYSFYKPTANVGKVNKKGYEIELGSSKRLSRDLNLWGNLNITHVKDKVIYREEPQLQANHLKNAGKSLGQTIVTISDGFMKNWDEIYASPVYASGDMSKLPGDFRVIDFDADGIFDDSKDRAPFGYSNIPQNTYSLRVGFDYKGFSAMVHFYGVNNVTRNVARNNFSNGVDLAYEHTLDYWSLDNPRGTSFLPRWKAAGNMVANYYQVDGSYCRLKNAEISYTFDTNKFKKSGMSSLRLYINGNNLIFWSKHLPDDRETGSGLAYPNTKRFNLGVDIKF